MRRSSVVSLYVVVVTSVLYLLAGPVLAEPLVTDNITRSLGEVKVFSLQQRDVIAIAVDASMPTDSVADPLSYKLEFNYNQIIKGNTLEIIMTDVSSPTLAVNQQSPIETRKMNDSYLQQIRIDKRDPVGVKIMVSFADKVKPQITTVRRKGIVHKDGTTDFRTYLVLNFPQNTIDVKTIVLDAGHGGEDSGAVNQFLCEKDLNLDIALMTQKLFRQKGYDVYMTRTEDIEIPMFERADAANILNAAVFISIHNNSMPEDMSGAARKIYRGTTVLYNSGALQPAQDLATIMCNELVGTLRTHQYPLQDRPKLIVLNSTWVPAVLAEIAMMPHPQDAKMISQSIYQQKAAEAIFLSTEKYFKNGLFSEGR